MAKGIFGMKGRDLQNQKGIVLFVTFNLVIAGVLTLLSDQIGKPDIAMYAWVNAFVMIVNMVYIDDGEDNGTYSITQFLLLSTGLYIALFVAGIFSVKVIEWVLGELDILWFKGLIAFIASFTIFYSLVSNSNEAQAEKRRRLEQDKKHQEQFEKAEKLRQEQNR